MRGRPFSQVILIAEWFPVNPTLTFAELKPAYPSPPRSIQALSQPGMGASARSPGNAGGNTFSSCTAAAYEAFAVEPPCPARRNADIGSGLLSLWAIVESFQGTCPS